MDIRPIVRRELLTATRARGYWSSRSLFAGIMLAIVMGVLGARLYWDRGKIADREIIERAAIHAFAWMLTAHVGLLFGVCASRAANSIALEKDRRTLDFLLATRLNNAEIVLGKLAACLLEMLASFAAGLPIVLVLHALGGIDLGLIAVGYGGLISTGFFMMALTLWISSRARDARFAVSSSVLWCVAWLCGPFFVSVAFTRVGARLPSLILAVNGWILASSPLGVFVKILGGATPSSGLLHAMAWMCGPQVAAGAVLVAWAIVGLRWAYRRNVSGDPQHLAARVTRPGWRLRPRPPMGDDPILWREMHTTRASLVSRALGLMIGVGLYGVLVYATYFFGRPAMIEVWRFGYSAGKASAERPETNLAIRFFIQPTERTPPPDLARIEFNLFLRFISIPFVLLTTLVVAGVVGEGITHERSRETWDSLIATSLSAHDILRSKVLAGLWRLRYILATLFGLWTIGLIAGAIHPAGYVASLLVAAAWIWLMAAFGLSVSVATKEANVATSRTAAVMFVSTCTLILPFALPRMLNSVLLGAGSAPFVAWMSLVSYRDLRNAWAYPVYPGLQWLHIDTGEGPLRVLATCLIGIIGPTLCGLYLWRKLLADFDRLIGRPTRAINPWAGPRVSLTNGKHPAPEPPASPIRDGPRHSPGLAHEQG